MAHLASMDRVFKALADKSRRRILDIVKKHPGCNVNSVCAFFKISRIGVMKHLGILEQVGLILTKKEGRNRRLHLNAIPIQMIHDRWMSQYSALWAKRLTQLKYELETTHNKERKGGGRHADTNKREDGIWCSTGRTQHSHQRA